MAAQTEQDINRAGSLDLIEAAFLRPAANRDRLHSLGVKLGSEEPIGVVSLSTLQAELELLGLSRQARRKLATDITGSLMKGGYNNIFPVASMLSIEPTDAPNGRFFRRSDINPSKASERLAAYANLLLEDVESRKTEAENEKQRLEAERFAELNQPSTASIIVVGSYDQQDFDLQVQSFRKTADKKTKVEPHSIRLDDFIDPTLSLLPREDVRLILKNGIQPEALKGLLPRLRAGVINAASVIEGAAKTTIYSVLDKTSAILEKPGQTIKQPLYTPRFMVETFTDALEDANKDPNISIRKVLPEISPGVSADAAYPRMLMYIWRNRYNPGFLIETEGVANLNHPTGKLLAQILEQNDPRVYFKKLKEQETIEINGQSLSGRQADEFLGPEVLTDTLLTRALFADVLGEIYPMPYILERQLDQEVGLVSLRYIAGTFAGEEVTNLLTPDKASSSVSTKELKEQANKAANALKSLKGGREVNQKRAQLQQEMTLLQRELRKAVQAERNPGTKKDKIIEAVSQRIPLTEPKAEDYTQGEASVGYTEATRRYKKVKDTNPEAEEPDPADFLSGEDSEGYAQAIDLYEAWMFVSPTSRIKKTKVADFHGTEKLAIVSLIPNRLLGTKAEHPLFASNSNFR